jgi:hypothetical protein
MVPAPLAIVALSVGGWPSSSPRQSAIGRVQMSPRYGFYGLMPSADLVALRELLNAALV